MVCTIISLFLSLQLLACSFSIVAFKSFVKCTYLGFRRLGRIFRQITVVLFTSSFQLQALRQPPGLLAHSFLSFFSSNHALLFSSDKVKRKIMKINLFSKTNLQFYRYLYMAYYSALFFKKKPKFTIFGTKNVKSAPLN